jgi:hypothetical protein
LTLFVDPLILIGFISLVLGLAAGFLMHRSDFCLAGMFRDLFLFRRTAMIKSLVLLVITSMVLFEAVRRLGFLSQYPFPLLYSPSPANVIGGLFFGIGMVLAGGCVVGTLYKMGSGSVLAFTAFAGLIAGSGLYAEFHPFWAAFVKKTTMFPGKITVSQIIGVDPMIPVLIVSIPCAVLLYLWHSRGELRRPSFAAGYIQPYKAALALSLIGGVSYALIGMPMGVTSSFTKIAGFLESVLFPDHFETLAFFKAVSLRYQHALSGQNLSGGPGPVYDALAAIQFPLIAGIILGSGISAVLLGEFHIYYRVPLRQYVLAGFGGVLMGLASRMAPTCNVWHLLGGLPILSASSILFLFGMLAGAWLGARLLLKVLSKTPGQSSAG